MANILKAIAEGTSQTATDTVKTTAKRAMANVPNPAEAMYNLGLGVGPLIRNIVEKAKSKDKKTEPATEKTQKKATENDTKIMNKMAMQLALSNSLLKEIRNLQIKQIASINKNGAMRGGGGVIARRMVDQRIEGASTTAASSMLRPTTEGKKEEEGMGTGTKLAMGAIGLMALWKVLPQEMKQAIGNVATEIIKEVKPVLVDGIRDTLKAAWDTSPVWTTIGGLLVAQVTGVLGLATNMAKAAIRTYKFTDNLADKYRAQPNTTGPSPTATQPAAVQTSPKVSQAQAEYEKLMNSSKVSDRYQAGQKVASKYGISLEEVRGIPAAAEAPVAAAKPSLIGNIAKNATNVARGAAWVGTALTVGEGAVDYYKAGKEFEKGAISSEEAGKRKGEAIGGAGGALALGAAGAATGGNIGMILGGAVGALFGGVGAAPGAAIGRLLGSLAGGYFGAKSGYEAGRDMGGTLGSISSSSAQSTAQAAVQNASLGGNEQQSLDIIEKVFKSKGYNDVQIRAAQIVAAAESGLLPWAHATGGEDSVGLFQLNRNGGEGSAYTVEQLKDPFKNASIVAEVMNTDQGKAFRQAGTVEEAVAALVRDFEKPSFVKLNGKQPYIADANAFNQYVNRGASKLGARLNSSTLAQAASTPGTGVTSSSVSSSAASSGTAFAATQQSLNDILFALSGERSSINIQQIITAAETAAAKEGGGGPKRTSPSGSDRAAEAAQHATGQ